MGWKWEVSGIDFGVEPNCIRVQLYAGASLLAAVMAMIRGRRAGRVYIRLEWRP